MDFKTATDIITSTGTSARVTDASAQKKSAIRFLSDSLFTSPPK